MKLSLIISLIITYLFCVVAFEAYSTPIVARIAVAVLVGLGVWAIATKKPASSKTLTQ